MATTLKQIEALPEDWPDFTLTLSAAAWALHPKLVWSRIEAYVAHRWTPRSVMWTVEGPGEWVPPLTPVEIVTVECWDGEAWEVLADPTPSALGGYTFAGAGPFRVSGIAGGGSPAPELPVAVAEAYRRLAEYFVADPGVPGARRESVSIGGEIVQSISRDEAWFARAMQNSGAADLLRPYRRAPGC